MGQLATATSKWTLPGIDTDPRRFRDKKWGTLDEEIQGSQTDSQTGGETRGNTISEADPVRAPGLLELQFSVTIETNLSDEVPSVK